MADARSPAKGRRAKWRGGEREFISRRRYMKSALGAQIRRADLGMRGVKLAELVAKLEEQLKSM